METQTPTEEELQREASDEQLVSDAFKQLLDSYLSSPHRKKADIITQAFNFAKQAHKGVRRLSGEPYIMHPIAVAQIASEEMGLGSTSICSALLHDVVEDTDYTVEDLENIFGKKIAQIVDGLTKISGGIFGDRASAQAENFRKLLLTMSDDIRVILIKICDRLHNMRTLASQPVNKQYKIAGETLYIYAPLANRLGLNKIKNELEDLSFRYEHPDTYAAIKNKLAATQKQRTQLFDDFTAPIRAALDKMGFRYEIKARVKAPYSIWTKMQNKHVSFEEIYDILAVRIIFTPRSKEEEINDCFKIYVAINKLYRSHPDRLRDWVNHPKANGYKALHQTFMSHEGKWIEVQIRSEHMNDVAEQGFAAHWQYKDGGELTKEEGELNTWLGTIKEILDDPQPDAMDFLDTVKLNLFASEIFVFTPKGEIKTMPSGSTALDFAFSIHTFIGSHCIGAKVNHKLVPLSHVLQSGDQVEIITSKAAHVQPTWINFANTAKAKTKIQAILRRDLRDRQKHGEDMLKEFLEKHEIEFSTANISKLCTFHNYKTPEKLFLAIGEKTVLLSEKDIEYLLESPSMWQKLNKMLGKSDKKKTEDENSTQSGNNSLITVGPGFNTKKAIYVTDENIRGYIFPTCCHPIPGDDILGYVNKQNNIEIHLVNCPKAKVLKASFGNKILNTRWATDKSVTFEASVKIRGIDRIGMLRDVTSVITDQMGVNIRQLTISCDDDIFEGDIDIGVHNRSDVKRIMDNLRSIKGMQEVSDNANQ